MEEKFLGKVFILTLLYFFVEFIGGIYYNSLALLTDSLFMLGNIFGQFLAILIHHVSKRPADDVMTFGYERVQVISALINGFIVGIMIFYVWIESYKKILNPEPIQELNVLVIAILGLFVNIVNIFQIFSFRDKIHLKGVMISILNDLLGSLSVLLSSVVIYFTKLYQIDAIVSFFMSLLMVYPVYNLIRESLLILLDAAPLHLTKDKVEKFIKENVPIISSVKSIHVWQITSGKTVLVASIEMKEFRLDAINNLKSLLLKNFGLSEVYIDIVGG